MLFEYGGQVADGGIPQEPVAARIVEASLKPKDPLKPDNPADAANAAQPLRAVKAPGTGLAIDVTA